MDTQEKFGNYLVLKQLGSGGMGEIYLGFDAGIKRQVAIKTIRLDHLESAVAREEFRRRFLREAQICGNLNHPNIVTIYEMGEDGDRLFIAMEYVEGESLVRKLEGGRTLTLEFVISTISQLCHALSYAHEQGVVHRDIKPGNIMVTPENQIKILDFGIALIVSGNETAMTFSEMFLGTPGYSSPEQDRHASVDSRSDIYSMGILLHEMITGRKPQLAPDTENLFFDASPASEPAPVEKNHASPMLYRTFAKALHPDPARRYRRVEDFSERLIRVLELPDQSPSDFIFTVDDDTWNDDALFDDGESWETQTSGKKQVLMRSMGVLMLCATIVAWIIFPKAERVETSALDVPSETGSSTSSTPGDPGEHRATNASKQPKSEEPSSGGETGGGPGIGLSISPGGGNDENADSSGGTSNTVVGRDLIINPNGGSGAAPGNSPGTPSGLFVAEEDAVIGGSGTSSGPSDPSEPDTLDKADDHVEQEDENETMRKEIERLRGMVAAHLETDIDAAISYQKKIVDFNPENESEKKVLFDLIVSTLPEEYGPEDLTDLLARFPEMSGPLIEESKRRDYTRRLLPAHGYLFDFLLLTSQESSISGRRGKLSGVQFWINQRHARVFGSLEFFYTPGMPAYDRCFYLQEPETFTIDHGYSQKPVAEKRFAHNQLIRKERAPTQAGSTFFVFFHDGSRLMERRFESAVAYAPVTVQEVSIRMGQGIRAYLIPENGLPLAAYDETYNRKFKGKREGRNLVSGGYPHRLVHGVWHLIVRARTSDGYHIRWAPLAIDEATQSLALSLDAVTIGDARVELQPIEAFFNP